jgi:hypothetical protein
MKIFREIERQARDSYRGVITEISRIKALKRAAGILVETGPYPD